MPDAKILIGDCREQLRTLEPESIDCVVTSPPYMGLRRYKGGSLEIGREKTIDDYIDALVEVFDELHRVLKPTGVVFLNIGDSYVGGGRGQGCELREKQATNKGTLGLSRDTAGRASGLKPRQLMLVPERIALALQTDNKWFVRQRIIWKKENPMPESVKNRDKCSFEHIWHLTKHPSDYYWDQEWGKTPLKDSTIARAEQAVRTFEKNENLDRDTKWTEVDGQQTQTIGKSKRHKEEQVAKMVAPAIKGPQPFYDKASKDPKKEKYLDVEDGADFNLHDIPRHRTGPSKAVKDKWSQEKGLNGAIRKNVWEFATSMYGGAHFATFPVELPKNCIGSGCPVTTYICESCYNKTHANTQNKDRKALPSMREDVLSDKEGISGRILRRSKILFMEMYGEVQEREASNMGNPIQIRKKILQNMREYVSTQEAIKEILFQGMCNKGTENKNRNPMCDLWANVHTGKENHQELFKEVRSDLQRDKKEKRICDDTSRISNAIQTGTSDVAKKDRICDGAQTNNVGKDRKKSNKTRSSASHQREEIRQQNRKPSTYDEGRTRQAPKAKKPYCMSSLRGDGPVCERCGTTKNLIKKTGTVLDPFGGSGTTAVAALQLGRNAIIIELNPEYAEIARKRISSTQPGLF